MFKKEIVRSVCDTAEQTLPHTHMNLLQKKMRHDAKLKEEIYLEHNQFFSLLFHFCILPLSTYALYPFILSGTKWNMTQFHVFFFLKLCALLLLPLTSLWIVQFFQLGGLSCSFCGKFHTSLKLRYYEWEKRTELVVNYSHPFISLSFEFWKDLVILLLFFSEESTSFEFLRFWCTLASSALH